MKILLATFLLAGASIAAQAQQFRFENPRLYHSRTQVWDSNLPDVVNQIQADASDNTYMALGYDGANFGTGYGNEPGPGPDYGIVSLTPANTLRWLRVYGQYSPDEALDGQLDANGNYYTCGYYRSQSTPFGPFTIVHPGGIVVKHTTTGGIAWAKGLGTGQPTDNDVATTLTKNLYEQIFTFGHVESNRGIFLRRLDTAGNITKVIVPTGQNNQYSYVWDALSLPDGSTIITGESRSPNVLGYAISPADQQRWGMMARIDTAGNVLWVNKFGTKGCGFNMAHDGSGNILVTVRYGIGDDSSSTEPYVLRVSPGGTVLNQYRTYSRTSVATYYPKSGNPAVAVQPNGGFAVSFTSVDQRLLAPHDTVLLGGGSRNGVVELFSAAGALQKILPIRSIGSSGAVMPSTITTLSGGRYAVAGMMTGRCNFGYGQFLTSPMFSGLDIFTAVISTTPPPIPATWPLTFGSTQDDYVRGVVRDAAGNTYVSMSFRGTITIGGATLSSYTPDRRDMAIAKFDKNGYLDWVQNTGNTTFNMEPQGVNLDAAGNVYWAGSFAADALFLGGPNTTLYATGSYDAFVARFDPGTGNCAWARKVGGGSNDYLYGCFVSNSGNVYAGGSYTGAINFSTTGGNVALTNAGGLDGFIVKFDNAGNGLYASRFGSTADDEVKSIEYMGGDLVACGYMGNNCTFPSGTNASPGTVTLTTVSGSRDGWAARINSEGRAVWVKNFGTIFNDEANSICMDPSTGNVFTAATVSDAPVVFNSISHGPLGGNDIMVVGWNFYTQAPVWGRRVGSGAGDAPSSIRWDGNRLVVAGFAGGSISTGSGGIGSIAGYGLQDAVVLRYDKLTGNVTSGQLVGGAGNDRALAMWCNTANREEYIGGVFSNTVNFPDQLVPAVPRTSNGAFDGFVMRIMPLGGIREGYAEETLGNAPGGRLTVYPVPAGKQLRVMAGDAAGLQAFDSKGTSLDLPMHTEGQETVLDVSGLKPGLYLLQAEGKTVRFVKE